MKATRGRARTPKALRANGGTRCPQRVDNQLRRCRLMSCAFGDEQTSSLEKPIHLAAPSLPWAVNSAATSQQPSATRLRLPLRFFQLPLHLLFFAAHVAQLALEKR
jgi:hypothetical protein